ncbi:RNA polymerase sigma factor [Sphingomonas sp. DT-207]|uniref:RNA polymerase sigma factor n=1 Tax=Sphingomonas sp. DT-207 TaxID=3396167 RepID=UPI003F1C7569
MTKRREALAKWVRAEILPHEHDLRMWLQRRFVAAAEVEDIVQECYCRLARLSDVAHIVEPRGYLFTIARNIAVEHRKRAAIVRLEPLSDMSDEDGIDFLSPERIAEARQDLGRLQAALDELSDRARRIFIMRKVEGLSQKEVARALGVTEAVVENDASRSLRAVLRRMTEPEAAEVTPHRVGGSRAGSH